MGPLTGNAHKITSPNKKDEVRSDSPILETHKNIHNQNHPPPPGRDRQQEKESTILVDEVVEVDQNSSSQNMQGKEESTSKVRNVEEIRGMNRDKKINSL